VLAQLALVLANQKAIREAIQGLVDGQGAINDGMIAVRKLIDADVRALQQDIATTARKVDGVAAQINVLQLAMSQPGAFSILSQTEVPDMSQWSLVFSLPGPSASDVKTQRLTITDNQGSDPVVKEYDATATQSEALLFAKVDGLILSASLVDVDGAGNQSVSRDETFPIVDNIAPPQPGDFGIVTQTEVA